METLGYVYLLLFVGLIIALCLFINRLTDKLNVPLAAAVHRHRHAGGRAAAPRVRQRHRLRDGQRRLLHLPGARHLLRRLRHQLQGGAPRRGAGRCSSPSRARRSRAGLVGVAVWLIFRLLPFVPDIGWVESMLVGSVISSTDAASVFNILRSRRLNLKYHTSSLLEMESGSNDPTSYMLTAVFTAVLAAQYGVEGAAGMGAAEIVQMLLAQVGFGALAGVAFGFLALFILKKIPFNMGQGGHHLRARHRPARLRGAERPARKLGGQRIPRRVHLRHHARQRAHSRKSETASAFSTRSPASRR